MALIDKLVQSMVALDTERSPDSTVATPIFECQSCQTLVFHPKRSTCPRCESGTLEQTDTGEERYRTQH